MDQHQFFLPSHNPHTTESFTATGFASPAQTYSEDRLSLDQHLITNPVATFIMQVTGSAMNPRILQGDLLIVDRSITAQSYQIVVLNLDGEFLVRQLVKTEKGIFLNAFNNKFRTINLKNESDYNIFGVVTSVIHKTFP